jgi:cell division septal protein FtsQ
MKIQKGNRRKRKLDKFWTGSGKFFLVLLAFYLLYFAINKIVKNEQNKKYIYSKNDIEISGNQILSETTILGICGFLKNSKEEIEIDPEQVAADLMSLHFIKGVSIKDRPPRKLNVTIMERRPVAFIYGRGLNLIDDQGYIIPVPASNMVWDLPLISGIRENLGKVGAPTSALGAKKALELITFLEHENSLLLGFISEINMNKKNYIEINLIRGGARIRINTDTFQKELFVLKNYLVNYADWAQLNKIEYIDLRFKDQLVIKYKA